MAARVQTVEYAVCGEAAAVRLRLPGLNLDLLVAVTLLVKDASGKEVLR